MPPIAFPDGSLVAQVRIARPTDRLAEVVAFYRDGLGLPQLTAFAGHAGYDGVMLGLPGKSYHLEFTQHARGSPYPAPSRDNLLVLYFPDAGDLRRTEQRLQAQGRAPVAPENPYWLGRSVTYEDPDGWRIVLAHGSGI